MISPLPCVLFLSVCPFPFAVFSCCPHLPCFSGTFCFSDEHGSWSQWGMSEGSLLSCMVLLQGPPLPATGSMGWTLRGKRHRNLAAYHLGVWTISAPSHSYQNSQNNEHPDAGLYTASSASKQTLHNVKTNWQPKSSSFVSRSIHPAMCKLWCPPEAERGTERWDVMGKAGLAVGAGRIPPHKAPGCCVSRGETLNEWAPMSSWGGREGVEALQKRHMSLQGCCLC